MELQNETPNYITRQDVINFPFQYKLWIIVNLPCCKFSKWNIDGTELELNLADLDDYLCSPESIFKIKSLSTFIAHMRDYGFYVPVSDSSQTSEVANGESKANSRTSFRELVMHFRHEHFLRLRIDLLPKVRRVNDSASPEAGEIEYNQVSVEDRLKGDICSTSYSAMSNMHKSRIRYKTILHFQVESKILEEKLRASELRSKSKGQEEDADALIELPANMFENPHDSVLYMGDEHRMAYAGFYGNCTNEQIVSFFGDYLPMYENLEGDDMERRVLDLNPPEKISSNVSLSADTTAQVIDDLSAAPSPPPEAASSLPPVLSVDYDENHSPSPPVASSSLQPIFIGPDDGEDISMDEFIRFNEQSSDTQPMQTEEECKVKLEVVKNEEDNENEANFKNFFRHYRQSLTFLYEKQ